VAVVLTPMDGALLRDVQAVFTPLANAFWASGLFPGFD